MIILASGIIYGSSFSFMKIAAAGGVRPLGMVFWFALLATCALLAHQAILGRLRRPGCRLLRFCIPWGILSVVFPNVFFFIAAGEIAPGIIAIGIALVPMLTLAGAILLGREGASWWRLLGLTSGAAGVMMILLPDASLPKAGDALYVLIAFAGAACYAAEHLFIDARAPNDVGIDQLLLLMFGSVSVMLLPLVAATGSFFLPHWPLGATEWAIVAIAAVTLLDYFFITLLILWAGPVFASQAAYIVTLAGVTWGMILFGDGLSPWIWGALGALIMGLTLVRPRVRAPEAPTPEASIL